MFKKAFCLALIAITLLIATTTTNAQTTKIIGDWTVYFDAGLHCMQARGSAECSYKHHCTWWSYEKICGYQWKWKNAACKWVQYSAQQYINTGKTGTWLCWNAADYGIEGEMSPKQLENQFERYHDVTEYEYDEDSQY